VYPKSKSSDAFCNTVFVESGVAFERTPLCLDEFTTLVHLDSSQRDRKFENIFHSPTDVEEGETLHL